MKGAGDSPAVEPAGGMVATTVREEFDLSAARMRAIDLNISLTKAIRAGRTAAGLTQAAFAERLGVRQPDAARLERFGPSTTLDALIGAFFALGGTGADLASIAAELDTLAGR